MTSRAGKGGPGPPDRRDFTRTQFCWLRLVSRDRELPPMAAHVAIALTRFFNRQTHQAWPSNETLADELDITPRAVRSIIGAMLKRGHVTVIGSRRGGRNHTNRLQLRLDPEKVKDMNDKGKTPKGGTPVPGIAGSVVFSRKGGTKLSERRNERVTKGGTAVPPNLLNEPTLEPKAAALASALPTGALAPPGSAWSATPANAATPQAASRPKTLSEALDKLKTNIIRDERGGQ